MKKTNVHTLISTLPSLSMEDLLLLKSEVQHQEQSQATEALWHV
jgi:hypothetical protein